MDSDHSRKIGSLKLAEHLLKRIDGVPSGPGAESSLISDIASSIQSGVNTSSVSLLIMGGTVNSGADVSWQLGSL